MNNDSNQSQNNTQTQVTNNQLTQGMVPNQSVNTPQPVQQVVQPGIQSNQTVPTPPAQQEIAVQQPVFQPNIQGSQNIPPVQKETVVQQPVVQQTVQTIQSTNIAQPIQQTVVAQPISAPVNNESLTNITDTSSDSLGANFVSTAKPLKKRMKPLVKGIIISVLLVIVVLISYFVLYPLIVKNLFNNSKKIFDSTIDTLTKEVNTYIDDWYSNKAIIDGTLTIDSNYDKLKDYSGYTYGARIGIDSEIKDFEFGYNIVDSNKNDYSQLYYVKNDDLYVRYSNYRDLIYLGSLKDSKMYNLYNSIYNNINSLDKVEKNDITYLVNKVSNSFKSTISEKKIVKSDATISVNGKTIKVIKSSYVMDKNTIINTKDAIINDIKNDDKSLEIIANLTGKDKEEIKELLGNTDLKLDDDYIFTINIYTNGIKVDFYGIEIFDNKNNINIHYYKNNDDFEIKANGEKIKDVIITGVKNSGKENVTINYDSKEIANLVVDKWEVNNKSFEYTLKKDNQEITGNMVIQYDKNNLKNELKIELKMKMDKYYINIGLALNDDQKSKIANINTGASKMISDDELNSILTQFNQLINSTPLGNLFKTSFGINDPSINNSNSLLNDLLTAVDNTPKSVNVETPQVVNE